MSTEATELLTRVEAAAYLRMSAGTLAVWASTGKGPRYAKLGRWAMYSKSDLDAYVQQCVRDPAGAAAAK